VVRFWVKSTPPYVAGKLFHVTLLKKVEAATPSFSTMLTPPSVIPNVPEL
jgi:hypothetical protein